jgi:hypothetical protein
MTANDADGRLSPDEAFAALGDEVRVGILRALGDAAEPLAFSELYDRLPVEDTSRFNYHLGELRGHFVRKDEAGYALDHPGRRVVEAIRSGAVTDDPDFERTSIDDRCPACDGRLEIRWRDGSIEVFCPGCENRWERSSGRVDAAEEPESGYLGRLPFPPAGLRNREAEEAFRAAHAWTVVELLAVGTGICPRCAATVETELDACPDHEDDGTCSNCRSSFAVVFRASCTNCPYHVGSAAALGLLSSPALLGFMLDHDIDPLAPRSVRLFDRFFSEYDEAIGSMDPLRVTLTFSLDGDELALRVDENGEIVDVSS